MDFTEYKTSLIAAMGAIRPIGEQFRYQQSLIKTFGDTFLESRKGLVEAMNMPISATETFKAFADAQLAVSSLVQTAASLNPIPNSVALCAQELSVWKSADEFRKYMGLRISDHGHHLNINADLVASMNRKPRINKRLQNIIKEGFSK